MTIHPGRHLSPELRQCLGRAGLPCLMTMARLRGEPSERALAAIRGIRDHLLELPDVDLSRLPSLEPEAMAAGITACDADQEWRERILRGMTLVALFDGEPSPEALELLERTARSFQVNASPVRSYRNVMQERLGMVRLDLVRRSFVRDAARATLRDGGLPMLAATLKVVSGHRDQATLERFQALQDYPNGASARPTPTSSTSINSISRVIWAVHRCRCFATTVAMCWAGMGPRLRKRAVWWASRLASSTSIPSMW